jgi:hypothetical protein
LEKSAIQATIFALLMPQHCPLDEEAIQIEMLIQTEALKYTDLKLTFQIEHTGESLTIFGPIAAICEEKVGLSYTRRGRGPRKVISAMNNTSLVGA